MVDRVELLEAALNNLGEGVALADHEGRIAFWNHAAEVITGYESRKMAGQNVRETLDALIVGGAQHWVRQTDADPVAQRGSLVHVQHSGGYAIALMAQVLILRDSLGQRIGSGAVFHPAAGKLPHGRIEQDCDVTESQAEVEDRLAKMHEDFRRMGLPLGVFWITADQACGLRRTHGSRAVEAMLEKMERTLATGLSPGEEIGRWGDDEFLVLSHERNAAVLAQQGQELVGRARTTEFRWWGDRISLTVSIGAAQAQPGEELGPLLERAQAAMQGSIHAGGNQITAAPGRLKCSPL